MYLIVLTPVLYKLKCNDCPNYYIGQTGRSFKTRYTEHREALHTTTYKIKLCRTHIQHFHTYTNIKTNLEILHILPKGPKLNTAEQYEIYKHYKQSPTTYKKIKYITNPIHSLTQSNTAVIITSLLSEQLWTGTSQPVPPAPSSIENDAHGIEKLLLKTQVSWTSSCILKWIY